MKHVKELVDLCVKKCSSEAELARRIGVHYQVINDMRHGRRAISPETVGLLCDVLELSGDEAREWLAISVIENPKNSSRAEVLRKAFFALWVGGVALGAVLPTESKAKSQEGASAIVHETNWTPRTFWKVVVALAAWARRRLQQAVRVAGLTGDCTAKPSTKLAMLANTRR